MSCLAAEAGSDDEPPPPETCVLKGEAAFEPATRSRGVLVAKHAPFAMRVAHPLRSRSRGRGRIDRDLDDRRFAKALAGEVGEPTIPFVAEHSPCDAGARHPRVAIPIARSAESCARKRSSPTGVRRRAFGGFGRGASDSASDGERRALPVRVLRGLPGIRRANV